ncbi:multidrug MFS transporter [Virgisporangium aliadipatigenens]|uniref:Multidrug MFS transporter n=1 Tax=Virgisporangium aliadipatigenens TaxID=741659 RepID=A0A8J4DQB9_9ACTN|nr:epoxide hydrolase family protein [Virgisporangium aliadipatigenens]GIJ45553.1 multidrug MFS transporter [Virgisporangium aliadipatigenens]
MIRPFAVDVPEDVLEDLRDRLRRTRWPGPAPGPAWRQGTDLDALRDLVTDWAAWDWRAHERRLNTHQHRVVDLGDATVHAVHERARDGRGIPLVLTHGWPSSFVEYLPLVPLLTDPAVHGIAGPAFDVVIPSLPGYGFSPRPPRTGINYRYVAGLWHRLMAALGYRRYGAGGGDFGAGVATYLALDHPDAVIGLHLTTPELDPPRHDDPSPAELDFLRVRQRWDDTERGYSAIQSTKPQTLGYALTDSPAGLAAWLLEKWRSWADPRSGVGRDFLLTTLTVYWANGAVTESLRDYYDNRWHADPIRPGQRVRVPTAYAGFDHQFVPEGVPPREWLERLYDLARYTPMPRGGHFAAVEQPDLLARDLVAFFTDRAA